LEPNGDTFLTDNGHAQAELLGRYYAPILSRKARGEGRGKLHVFVSPMQRNLETVAPLMRMLRAEHGAPDLQATVNKDQFEVPAIRHPDDGPRFSAQVGMQAAGKLEEAELAAQQAAGSWKPCGLSECRLSASLPLCLCLPPWNANPPRWLSRTALLYTPVLFVAPASSWGYYSYISLPASAELFFLLLSTPLSHRC
jgi:hypothetical protein